MIIIFIYFIFYLYTFTGNLEEEVKVLAWLEHQLQSDEIEDVTDEMLDMLIQKLPYVAVLFCKLSPKLMYLFL